ncbi:MAG: hypothetical protein IPN86_16225 [Saprospiraceae bacterium]|nr:hypothetical protein [Saprospiraceae bacterium]
MAEDMKPYIVEDKTKNIQDLLDQSESDINSLPSNISLGEAKRIELIRKMKQDTDKKEYMIMFNVLMIALAVVSVLHFVMFGTIFSLVCMLLCLVYFVYIRKRLTAATLVLAEYKNNFDKYLWEGYYLKEMRYSAVKLAYFVFFPLLVVFFTDIFRDTDERISLWMGIIVAFVISSLGWLIYFADDKEVLEDIESELKSLEYL